MLYPKIVLGLCVVEGWLAGVVSGFGSFLYLRLYCANKKRVGTKVESGFSVFFFSWRHSVYVFLRGLAGAKNHNRCCCENSLDVGVQAWHCVFVFSDVCFCDLAAFGSGVGSLLQVAGGWLLASLGLCCFPGVVSGRMPCSHNRAFNARPNWLGPFFLRLHWEGCRFLG